MTISLRWIEQTAGVDAGDQCEAARAAFAKGAWREAADGFAAADAEAGLSAGDFERWGLAAFLVGRDEVSDSARERAHHAFLAEGDPDGAARVGHILAVTLHVRGEVARAGGWFATVQAVLDRHRMTGSVWALYLQVSVGMRLLFGGDPESAVAHFRELAIAAEAVDDAELQALIRNGLGQSLVAIGAVADGLQQLDAVMVHVTTGKGVSPQVTGLMYCAVIETCRRSFDLQRANEWTTVLSRWCADQQGMVPYRGQCLVHRSEVLQLHGAWGDACDEVETVLAMIREHPRDPAAAMAHYQRGELHRLRGELAEAEASYRLAAELGRDPEPGLALLRFAQGDVRGAWATMQRAAVETQRRGHERLRLLPAYIDIALAARAIDAAADAAEELAAAAQQHGSVYMNALASFAWGQVLLAREKPQGALVQLRTARIGFQSLGAAYDAARCRAKIGEACRALGDDATAELELAAARSTFEELGAAPDRRQLDQGSPKRAKDGGGSLTPRESQVLRLVATGATNRAIAERLYLSERTVARHVANIFLKLGVSTRSAATAYAFEHRLA